MERERSKSPEGLNAMRAVSPDALSPLADAAWSWTGGLPVTEQREAGWSDGEQLPLCRIGAWRCGTTGMWWAATAAMAGGRRRAEGAAACGGAAQRSGSRRSRLSYPFISFLLLFFLVRATVLFFSFEAKLLSS